ncbi:P-loop containing nucleoside triphosphate hydrolase protein [Mycena sanguinolenta]|nr:P-loop containing nucleoside triphosphate hydrolase protein [Mycena sanguinolenta]
MNTLADDLMQTSCGSPCYTVPELVVSEGLYVGSAVDIWNYGVILYRMLAGYLRSTTTPPTSTATTSTCCTVHLLDKTTYRYLGQHALRPTSSPGACPTDDALRFDQLKVTLKTIGLSKRHVAQTCQLIAAILHLGNLDFIIDRSRNEDATVVRDSFSPSSPLAFVADFLGVPARDLENTLSYRTKLVKKLCTVFLDADGASDNRDDLAKTLYSLLFAWLDERNNQRLCRDDFTTFLALLDLPGPQNLSSRPNSLDQLSVCQGAVFVCPLFFGYDTMRMRRQRTRHRNASPPAERRHHCRRAAAPQAHVHALHTAQKRALTSGAMSPSLAAEEIPEDDELDSANPNAKGGADTGTVAGEVRVPQRSTRGIFEIGMPFGEFAERYTESLAERGVDASGVNAAGGGAVDQARSALDLGERDIVAEETKRNREREGVSLSGVPGGDPYAPYPGSPMLDVGEVLPWSGAAANNSPYQDPYAHGGGTPARCTHVAVPERGSVWRRQRQVQSQVWREQRAQPPLGFYDARSRYTSARGDDDAGSNFGSKWYALSQNGFDAKTGGAGSGKGGGAPLLAKDARAGKLAMEGETTEIYKESSACYVPSGFFRTPPASGYPEASFHPSGRVSRTSDPRPLYMLMHPA